MTLDEVFNSIDPKWTMEQWPTEIRGFADLLRRDWPAIGADAVVELGVRHGGTSALWHQLLPGATVIGVDRIGYDSYQEPEFSQRAIEMEMTYPRFRFIEGDTADPATYRKVVNELAHKRVGLLFIDADHSDEAVRRDYATFSPLVVTDGLIAFHDIVDSHRTGGGVARFWKTLPNKVCEFSCGGDWGGIGVVRV